MPNSEDNLPVNNGHNKGQGEEEGRRALPAGVGSDGGSDSSSMPNLCKPSISCSSPPRLVSVAEVLETARDVSNLAIAHEVVINSNFQFQQKELPQNSLERKVKEIMHQAFWDCLQAQLNETPPQYCQAIKLLQEVKESLLSLLLPGHTRLRSQIGEVLDMELIQQQANHNALDIHRLAGFIISTMGRLCAPVRDAEIKKLKDTTGTISLFREIFRVLDLMKIDMLNFTIKTLKPHLQQQSVQYERSKFQEFLNKQPNALEHTTAWLKAATKETISSISENRSNNSAVVSPDAVLNQGYMNLLKWNHDTNAYPETVLMDKSRLQELQWRLHQLTLVATVLLVTTNAAGAAIGALPGFVDKLKQVTCALLDEQNCNTSGLGEALHTLSDQAHREVNRSLTEHGYPPLTNEQEAILKGQVRSIRHKSNVVRILIGERINSYVKGFLSLSNPQNCHHAVPRGLAPIQAELRNIGSSFRCLVHHNRLVFGPYYSGILTKVLFTDGDIGVDSR